MIIFPVLVSKCMSVQQNPSPKWKPCISLHLSVLPSIQLLALPPDIIINDNKNTIPFINNFRYLGACITLDLTENTEIKVHINKAKSQMGLLRHFFTCRDVDRRVKYWVYATGPLNTLLWGSKSWNINEHNTKKLWAFHHTAIRCIFGIKWSQMQEQWITNEEVQSRFLDIPNTDTYIIRRTNQYIGKTIRANNNSLNKKCIGAWIFCPRKPGRPQNSSNNNFMFAIQAIIPGRHQQKWQIRGMGFACARWNLLERQNRQLFRGTYYPRFRRRLELIFMQNLRFDNSNSN